MHPPGDEIQCPRQTQTPPAVPGAQQNFGAKAKEGRPFQKGRERPLHPCPVLPGHGVAEHHIGLVQRQPCGKQRRCQRLTAGPQPVPEQRVILVPQPAKGGLHAAGAPPCGGKVKDRRGEQRQKQSVCKFKQKCVLRYFFLLYPSEPGFDKPPAGWYSITIPMATPRKASAVNCAVLPYQKGASP